MSDLLTLPALKRTSDEKVKYLKQDRYIPAVFYGSGQQNVILKVHEKDFIPVYRSAGENTLVELSIDGENKKTVLIHDIARDPVSSKITHVDFINVDMEKEITTNIPLEFTGIAPAVKDLGGVLTVNKHELHVRCLPKDLVHSISIDISPLVNFHTVIRVSDVLVPKGLTVFNEPSDVVVTAVPPRTDIGDEQVTPVVVEEEAKKEEGEEKKEK